MGSHHPGGLLSLLRQGLTIGVQFGTQSLEALLWVAQSIEEGIYADGSLRRTPDGIAFELDNPILRVGAFSDLSLRVNGTQVPGDRVRLRSGEGTEWRLGSSIRRDAPWELRPGDRSEFEVQGSFGHDTDPITVRIELRTPAIPPVVWFEFTEKPVQEGAAR
ncbi:MAG TPA: hypothetical protein VMF04_02490 [Thermoplasmata archaeon]|nr:hypothetical protein [Thermoplasmata archaeon]